MKRTWSTLLVLLLAAAAGSGEEKDAGKPRPKLTPLRVEVVFLRYQGDKKLGSLPYTMFCNAGASKGARVRVGVDVPIATRVDNASQVVYKSVGMAVDCDATEIEPGLYGIELNTDQSSIYSGEGRSGAGEPAEVLLPSLRSFRSSFTAVLRDGQSMDYAAATDPLSGEVLKIHVTMNVAR